MKILNKKMIWSFIIGLAGLALLTANLVQNTCNTTTVAFAAGMTALAIARLIQLYRVSKSPQLIKKYEIEQKEERFISIAEKSGRFTFLVTMIVEFITIFALILINKNDIATMISFILAIQILVYLSTYYYLCKKY